MDFADEQQNTLAETQTQNVGGEPTENFFVKTLTGETMTIAYNKDYNIGDLKNYIQTKKGIPVDQQRLIFQGKQLDDVNTIGDYNIVANSNIHLVLRVKGGE